MGARTGLFVPMLLRDRAIGVISAHDREGADARFTDEDVRLAEAFAARAAVAVDLSERVATDALRRVVSAQELERQRLARELHDETGQALTSILLGLKGVEDADRPGRFREGSSASSESLSWRHSRTCAAWPLSSGRRRSTTSGSCPRSSGSSGRCASRPGSRSISSRGSARTRLPAEVETTLYRITQEALTNVVKHAQARHVSIVLTRRNSAVAAVIEDDGRGFDESRVERSRAARDAGSVWVLSAGGSRSSLHPAPARRCRSRSRSRDDSRPRRRRPRGRPLGPPSRAGGGGRHRGRGRGGRSSRCRVRGPRAQARRHPDGRRHAGREWDRGHCRGPARRRRRRRC